MSGDFVEYLNSKGVLVEKPKVKLVPDDVDMPSDRTAHPPKGKGMNDVNPYCCKEKNKKGSEKGLAYDGDDKLKYNPTDYTKPAPIPTAENFAVVQKLTHMIQHNPRVLESLINEFNKSGLLGPLVGELVTFRETFSYLAEVMGHETYGPVVCNRFANALKNEDVAAPFGDNQDMEAGGGDENNGEPVTCPHCGGDITDVVNGGGDQKDDLEMNASDEEGGESMPQPQGMPAPQPQAKQPMTPAFENFRQALRN